MLALPLEYKLIAGTVVLAAASAGAAAFISHERSIGQEREEAKQTAQALAATQENLRESNRRTVAVEGHANEADQAASAARADADSARTADQRLRLRLAAAERSRPANDPASAASGATADPSSNLYADVLARTLDAARLIGDFADQSRIAGTACQRSYESLSK